MEFKHIGITVVTAVVALLVGVAGTLFAVNIIGGNMGSAEDASVAPTPTVTVTKSSSKNAKSKPVKVISTGKLPSLQKISIEGEFANGDYYLAAPDNDGHIQFLDESGKKIEDNTVVIEDVVLEFPDGAPEFAPSIEVVEAGDRGGTCGEPAASGAALDLWKECMEAGKNGGNTVGAFAAQTSANIYSNYKIDPQDPNRATMNIELNLPTALPLPFRATATPITGNFLTLVINFTYDDNDGDARTYNTLPLYEKDNPLKFFVEWTR